MASRRRRKSSLSGQEQQLDCTSKCQLLEHAHVVLRITALRNLELFKHCYTYCRNPWNISDETNRTPLHIAASTGSSEIVNWLLRRKGRHKRINIADNDSYWTPLHRSAYFGYPGIMVQLVRAGGSLCLLDKDNWSPLNVLQGNYVDLYPAVSEVSLYVWGNNSNMTLGHDKCRSSPELLEALPSLGNVSQVVLCKFHTLILTERGCVYSCGHGTGGRLGHGNENTVVSPKVIESLSKSVTGIAAARNHSVFLNEEGSVFTCGINDAQQLGHSTKTGTTIPTPTFIKPLKSKTINLIGAGRYHTALASTTQVFSFGKNLGQLGYLKTSHMQATPKTVTGIVVDEGDTISQLSVSDAATACLTSRRHQIFVCTNYTVLRCERYNFPDSLSISQFVVCASLGELDKSMRDVTSEPNEGRGLKIALLDSENKLWFAYWSEYSKKGCVPPKVIHGGSKYSVSHFSLTKNLTIVTTQGEVYTGPLSNDPSLLDLKRIPYVQQAKRIFTDFKAINLAFLQNVYSPLEFPLMEPSSFAIDVYNLLSESELPQSVADVKLIVSGSIFMANSLILSSNSKVFSSLFSNKPTSHSFIQSLVFTDSVWCLILNSFNSEIFQLFLFYLYGEQVLIKKHNLTQSSSPSANPLNSTSKSSLDNTSGDDTISTNTDWNILYDQYGVEKNSFDQLSQQVDDKPHLLSLPDDTINDDDVPKYVHVSSSWLQDLKSLLELAECFKVQSLIKRLNVIISTYGLTDQGGHKETCVLKNDLILRPNSVPHNVLLVSEEGREFKCHKCILVTRSDYFQSMLLRGWRESTCEDSVTRLELPVSSIQLQVLVDYFYKDTAPQVLDSNEPDFITSILVMADQFLLSRLKSICEHSLCKCINIRNVVYIMEFSMAYNAVKLQQTCQQFICNNLPVLLEGGSLESLPIMTLDRISCTYREMFSVTVNRHIHTREPTQEELPVSYLHNRVLEFSESEDDLKSFARATTPTRAKSPLSESSTNSLRKKKKRRSNYMYKEEKNHVTLATNPVTLATNHVTLATNHMTSSPSVSPDILPSLTLHTHNEEEVAPNEPINNNNGTVTSPPCWSRSLSVPDSCSSFKDIMEEEIKKHKKKTKNKSLSKPIPLKNVSQEVPKSAERIVRRTHSESSESINPWGANSPSAQISLRDLMAAEEEKSNRKKFQMGGPIGPPSIQRSSSYEDTNSKNTTTPQSVSFADIVSDQMKEMDLLSEQSAGTKKPLHLIQIEEKAIEELRELYKADNNPEEFITIERIPAQTLTSSVHKKKTTPTSSSVWAVKTVFK